MGKGLSEKIKVLIGTDGLEPSHCHSQGTNNKYAREGVQANILCENSDDFCTLCGSHNFILFLADITNCLSIAFNFSGIKNK